MKRYLLLVVLALLAAPTVADLVINFTVVPLTLGDVIELSFTRSGNDLQSVLTYEMKTDTGEVYRRGGNSVLLTGAQKTAIVNYLNNVALPAANAAEGLE